MAGGPATVAGGIVVGTPAPIFAAAPSAPCSVVSARAAADKFCLTSDAGNSQVSLTWTPSASKTNLTIYDGITPGIGKPAEVSTVTDTSALVTGLANGTTYYFWLVVGKVAVSNTVSATPMTVPGAPAGLTATAGNAQVTLSWTSPASDGGTPVTGYNLYAGTTADFTGGAPVAKVTGTVVTVTGLVNGTPYYFRVTAVNRVGEGPASAEAKAVPVTVPGAPTGLTATPGNSRVILSWAAPASGGAAISGYIIYRGTSPGGETGVPVNGSLVSGTSYAVAGLTNGTTYYFKVFAVNAVGQSPPSEEVSATLPPIVPSSPPASNATTPASNATTPGSNATTPSTITPSTITPSTPATASTSAPAFAPPTGLTATAGNTQVRLSWTAPASDGGSSVISYKIYIATVPGGQGSRAIGSSKSTDATVTHLPNGTVYYFMVTAVDAAGNESPFSTEVSAEPAGSATGVTVSLNSQAAPRQLIALLAAVAAMVAAGAFTLIARRRRRFRSPKHARPERSGQQMAVASDVRAVPGTCRPDVVSVRDTGQEPTHTVRLEPHSGAITTMIKEGRP